MQEYYRAVGPAGVRVRDETPASVLAGERDISETAQAAQSGEEVGQGTYLYGNLEPGSVSVGERVREAETAPGLPGGVAGVPGEPVGSEPPFEDLYAAIEMHPGIKPVTGTALKNALQGRGNG